MPSSRFARIFGNPLWAVFALIGLFGLLFFAVPLYAACRITLFLQLAVFIIAISLLAALGLFQRRRFKTLCAFLLLALLLVMSAARITSLYDALKFQILAPRMQAAAEQLFQTHAVQITATPRAVSLPEDQRGLSANGCVYLSKTTQQGETVLLARFAQYHTERTGDVSIVYQNKPNANWRTPSLSSEAAIRYQNEQFYLSVVPEPLKGGF